jgi:Uma2 family endonuclease
MGEREGRGGRGGHVLNPKIESSHAEATREQNNSKTPTHVAIIADDLLPAEWISGTGGGGRVPIVFRESISHPGVSGSLAVLSSSPMQSIDIILPTMPLHEPRRLRPLRRVEYDQLVELGVFANEKIELLQGGLVPKTPQGSRHAFVIQVITRQLVMVLRDRVHVRVQLPFAASDISEPEPDVALMPPGDYYNQHPTRALLVIEVADTSLREDRDLKSPIYAAAGVPEFWLIDVNAQTVTVYRNPDGGAWTEMKRHNRDETLALASFPDVTVALPDLFPQR